MTNTDPIQKLANRVSHTFTPSYNRASHQQQLIQLTNETNTPPPHQPNTQTYHHNQAEKHAKLASLTWGLTHNPTETQKHLTTSGEHANQHLTLQPTYNHITQYAHITGHTLAHLQPPHNTTNPNNEHNITQLWHITIHALNTTNINTLKTLTTIWNKTLTNHDCLLTVRETFIGIPQILHITTITLHNILNTSQNTSNIPEINKTFQKREWLYTHRTIRDNGPTHATDPWLPIDWHALTIAATLTNNGITINPLPHLPTNAIP